MAETLHYQPQEAPRIEGNWIWDSPETSGSEMATCLFRRTFNAEELAADARVFLSADGRYRAYLNGELVSRGPCRGTPEFYHYETVKLAGRLRPGRNVLAVEVRYYGVFAPVAEVHRDAGLWAMIGPTSGGDWLATGEQWQWKAFRCDAQSPQPTRVGEVWPGYAVVDPCQDVDLRRMPDGWTKTDFDDASWAPAVNGQPAMGRYSRDRFSEFYRELVAREIPPLEEKPIVPVSVTGRGRIVPDEPPEQARQIAGELKPLDGDIPPFWGEQAQALHFDGTGTDYVIVNVGELTTGYPRLTIDAPAGTIVETRYCEGLSADRRKAVRDDPAAGTVEGYFDLFTCREGRNVIEPFVWRTFRFLRIAVHHPAGPAKLVSLETTFTGYPYQMQASFESSDPLHKTLWDVSWRTARLCAHEHYEDCPYYEQLQYTGDTRLQALVSYLVAGDYTLARQALRQFARSRRADGILLSRAPSNERAPQIIPNFSLIWIEFLEDYYRYSGDASLLAELLATADGVLAWFEQFDRDGILVDVPYWIFTDWSLPSSQPAPTGGLRLAGSLGELNLRRLAAMQAVARMNEALGRTAAAREMTRRAKTAARAVKQRFYSKADGLFRDDPDGAILGEHASILAILCGLVTPRQGRINLRRLQRRKDLARTTIYWSYYTFRAHEMLGLYEQAYRARLGNWTHPLALHASTWFEQPEPSRSDCHAWGSWIMCDMLTAMLGVTPAEAGFAAVRVAPQVLDLDWARGTVPTPRGAVSVSWRREDTQIRCEITLPEGVGGQLVAPDGQTHPLAPGRQEKTLAAVTQANRPTKR